MDRGDGKLSVIWYERDVGAGHRASLVVFGALALIPARALAQSTPSSARGTVTWDAPASCPSAEVVDARIAERVDIPFGDVRVRVTEVDEGVRVDMTADGADRSFVAPTCDDAAVIVALAAHAKLEAEKPAAPPLAARGAHDDPSDTPCRPPTRDRASPPVRLGIT